MPAFRALLALSLAAILLIGCGGNGGAVPSAGSTGNGTGGAQSGTPTDAAPSTQSAADELPGFMSDFDRVCETQIGFGGAAAYEAGPGTHPVVLFYDVGDPASLIMASVTLPAGWTVTEDANYEDNSELADVQLVACSRRTQATATGTMCDFTLDDDSTATLELTDTTYELSVYAAATGEQVGDTQTLEASSTECPYFVSFREGDTSYLNTPDVDQYINALKGSVAP